MTQAEQIALAILEGYAGPYYCAKTPTQRQRTLHDAALSIAPLLTNPAAVSTPNGPLQPGPDLPE